MKQMQRYSISLMLSLVMLFALMPPAQAANNNYKLTGNGADDIVSVATAQKGLGSFENGTSFGFPAGQSWCAYFTCWAGRTAGCNFPKSNLPYPNYIAKWFVDNNAGTFYYFRDENYSSLLRIGVKNKHLCVKSSRSSFSPKKGDLICYLWTKDN